MLIGFVVLSSVITLINLIWLITYFSIVDFSAFEDFFGNESPDSLFFFCSNGNSAGNIYNFCFCYKIILSILVDFLYCFCRDSAGCRRVERQGRK